MKRTLMTSIGKELGDLVEAFDLELPANDVQAWLEGPAVLVDVIAVY